MMEKKEQEVKEIRLKVAEAMQDDVNKGIVRIDTRAMNEIEVKPGDIVEIEGERKTVAIVDRAYPADVGLRIVRMDGLTRYNAKTSIGEEVTLRKAEIKEASKITIAPAQRGVYVQVHPETIKRSLLGRPVVQGDIISIGASRKRRKFGEDLIASLFQDFDDFFALGFGEMKFVVANTHPKGPVLISEITTINVSPEAIEVRMEKVPEVTYEDVGGLKEEIQKIREMVELPLKHPEIFARLGIEPPKGVLLYGPPGCGKTLLARAVANESDAYFISISGPEVVSKWVGEAEKRIREIFDEAEKNAPAIIFIDELDAIAPKREEATGEVERRMVSQLLCLHPDTPIYLENGVKTIKEIFEETPGKILEYDNVTYKIPYEELKVQALDPVGRISKAKALVVTKVFIPRAYKIKLENQAELIVSPITKFLSISNEGLEWVEAGKSKDKYILLPRRLEFDSRIVKIDPFEFKNREEWIVKLSDCWLTSLLGRRYFTLKEIDELLKGKMPSKNLSTKVLNLIFSGISSKEKIESELGISRKSLNNALRRLQSLDVIKIEGEKIELKIQREDVRKNILGFAIKEGKLFPLKLTFIRIPEILDEDLARFLGYLLSEGNLGEYRITISGEVCGEAAKLGEKLFGIKPKHYFKGKVENIYFYSRALQKFLTEYFNIPKGKKSDKIEIPRQIFSSPPSVKAAFIAALLEGDGNVGRTHVRFYSSSKKFIYQLSQLLLTLGITSRIKHYSVYTLQLFGGGQVFSEFCEKVLPFLKIERKRKFLEELSNKARKFSTIIYPIKEAVRELREKYGVRIDDNMYRYLSPNTSYRVNSNVLAYLIQKFDSIEDELVEEIRLVKESEIYPCKVVEVEEIEGCEMYDLTTTFSNFIAGEVPVIVHNTCMDGLKRRGRVIVIGATNRPNALDPALRRPGRFDREIEIGVPDRDGRLEILKIHTRNMPLAQDVDLGKLADITYGFVGADLEALCKEAAMNVLRKVLPDLRKISEGPVPKEILEKLVVTMDDFKEALKVVRPSAMREVLVEIPKVKWEDIGGLEGVKQKLKEAVEWPLKYPEVYSRMGIRPPKGILLYGPSGCGKTLLAKAVATESQANFISVRGPELFSKWFGESEKAVREIFRKARQVAPCIICFDEIDAIAPRRGLEYGTHAVESVVNQLLSEIDGLQELSDVVVIGCTNRPDIIDPALLRPGRFDRLILVPPPDEKARLEILKIHTRNMPLAKDVDLKKIAEMTENFSGADLEAICREAAMLALRENMEAKEVTMKHFEKAIEEVGPSLSKDEMKVYESFEERAKAAKAQVPKELTYLG